MELWHEGRHLPPSTDVRELWMKQQQAGSLRLAYSLTRSPVFKPIRISHGQGVRSVEGLRESSLATPGSNQDSFSPAGSLPHVDVCYDSHSLAQSLSAAALWEFGKFNQHSVFYEQKGRQGPLKACLRSVDPTRNLPGPVQCYSY